MENSTREFYRITVEKIVESKQPDSTYNRERAEKLYQQEVPTIPLPSVIAVVNGLRVSND